MTRKKLTEEELKLLQINTVETISKYNYKDLEAEKYGDPEFNDLVQNMFNDVINDYENQDSKQKQ